MKKYLVAISLSTLAMLSACGGNGDDKLASRVENAADDRADAMEARADALDEQAEQVRETGENRADAIDAADVNADAMSDQKKDAIVANQAPAVK